MHIKQNKLPPWVGAFQVQVTNSMFYVNLISSGMMVLTFWYTAGYQIRDRYMPWLNIWMFVAVVAVVVIVVMFMDYKFVYPSRQAFQNEQACKHENPAMEELRAIRENQRKIMQRLGIE